MARIESIVAGLFCCVLLGAADPAEKPQDPARKELPSRVDTTDEASREAQEAARAQAREKALEDGWPDTAAGIMAWRWVDALSAGSEAIERFLLDSLSEESLAKRPMQERVESSAKLHEQLGDLILASVEESETYRLVADLLSEEGTKHRFVFTLAEEPPHALVSIGMMHAGGHGGHGGHAPNR